MSGAESFFDDRNSLIFGIEQIFGFSMHSFPPKEWQKCCMELGGQIDQGIIHFEPFEKPFLGLFKSVSMEVFTGFNWENYYFTGVVFRKESFEVLASLVSQIVRLYGDDYFGLGPIVKAELELLKSGIWEGRTWVIGGQYIFPIIIDQNKNGEIEMNFFYKHR